MKTWSIFLLFGVWKSTLISLECMSALWRPKGWSTHSLFYMNAWWSPKDPTTYPFKYSKCANEPLMIFSTGLSAWVYSKALSDPLHTFILWKCTLLILHAHFHMHSSYFMLSFIDFHIQLHVMDLCTCSCYKYFHPIVISLRHVTS